MKQSGIASVALSGIPANAGEASANPNQAITLQGSGLSTGTDVLLRYVSSSGDERTVLLNPSSASLDGTTATLIVPEYANGAFALQVLGASLRPLLQIVPVINTYSMSGTSLQLLGRGFVEGGASYQLAGKTVVDPDISANGINVFANSGDNGGVTLSGVTHGLGAVSVTTAGGTSAPISMNLLNPGLGFLNDVAVDRTTGQIWVIDGDNPAEIQRVDSATGIVQQVITLTTAGFGSTAFIGGLQILPAAMTLNGVSVPAGSLLVTNGQASNDRIIAVNPGTGAVIASLTLGQNYQPTAGLYDPVSGHLFLVSSNRSPDRLYEIDPTTGAELGAFTLPFDIGHAGMALDPVTGNIWVGNVTNLVAELTRAGSVVRQIDLTPRGLPESQISGLAFDAANNLIVAASNGAIYRITIG